ncbi:MAG: hypothetical protein QOF05_1283 [Sphingomonadales bacterium]|jgi:hypothetical protein|nr:hypothetical protein [Sphingomonadales bacterium]
MIYSLSLVAATALITFLIMRWQRSPKRLSRPQTGEEKEAGRAKAIGEQLDDARDRLSDAASEGNKVALAKAVKAALWVTEARLNFAVPELLEIMQLWPDLAKLPEWEPPQGVTNVDGLDDAKSPWAAWRWNEIDWRVEAEWRPSILPDEAGIEIGTCKVLVDGQLVLDMTISSKDLHVMWIDALRVGPWVSELLAFTGARRSDAQALSSEKSARQYQDRADKIHWS